MASAQAMITGEVVPSPDISVKKDDVWTSLFQSENDADCISIITKMSAAVCKALQDKVKGHLLDGVHTLHNESENERFSSVLPHSKLPERAFGQLGWLLRHRPNSTKLANEAHIVYGMN